MSEKHPQLPDIEWEAILEEERLRAPGGGAVSDFTSEKALQGGLISAPIGFAMGGVSPGPPKRSVATLPGRGQDTPWCGQMVGRFRCELEMEATVGQMHCDNRECPQCAGPCLGHEKCPVHLPAHPGGRWSHITGMDAAHRIEDFLDQNGLGRLPLYQTIYSEWASKWKETDDHWKIIRKLRQSGERRVRQFARRGRYFGCVVVHLWRGCEGRYDTWGPHAHLMCAGIDVRAWNRYQQREIANHRKPKFILKQVCDRNGKFKSYRGWELAKHLTYELGHAAILPDVPAVTWFGGLYKWKQPEVKNEAPTPICSRGHEMTLFDHHYSTKAMVLGGPTVTMIYSCRSLADMECVYAVVSGRGEDPHAGPPMRTAKLPEFDEDLFDPPPGGPGWGRPPPVDECAWCSETDVCGAHWKQGYR